MKPLQIVVLNGSPKGSLSITKQYVKYIQTLFPVHSYTYFPIAQQLPSIENNSEKFDEIIEAIKQADGIIWVFPVYYMLVNSNYKRFIELLFERAVEEVFEGKYAISLSTSIKFYDHIAHNYLRGITEDLQMKFVDSASYHMNELLQENHRKNIKILAENFFNSIVEQRVTTKCFSPLNESLLDYHPSPVENPVSINDKKIVILSDATKKDSNLQKMIHRTTTAFANKVELYNLHDVKIITTCQGCLQCAYDFNCTFKENDGFTDFCEENVKQADVLILAGKIQDRFLSSRWKLFFDRYFYNNHTPTFQHQHIGFLISGPMSQTGVVREHLLSFVECHRGNVIDFITDEFSTSKQIDDAIDNFARKTAIYVENDYFNNTFRGVAGKKLFRDALLGGLKTLFQADHRYYKKHDFYKRNEYKQSFRQKILNSILSVLMKFKFMRKRVYPHITEFMVQPYKQIVKETQEKQ
ncbi:MAG: NAD(P)H-dependent oxidoreductase [Asgard group archaeon]|nr:NAD(P)H-dependent oxidoreductase [Asgard group archaeon]